jgi:hypothetical protein
MDELSIGKVNFGKVSFGMQRPYRPDELQTPNPFSY